MSTNGTQVHEQGGRSRTLHRDGCLLSGEGFLMLGRAASGEGPGSGDPTGPIAYRCALLGGSGSDDTSSR